MAVKPLNIWRFRDGKPGHEQQTLGLVKALGELVPVEVVEFDVREHDIGFTDWLIGRFPAGLAKPRPDLLIGAGHATHWDLLAAKKTVGGRAVVLMKPSLPASLFDLIIAPEHDGLDAGDNVIVTRGVLNAMVPGEKKPDSLLVLLGGESKHADWDNATVLKQVEAIVATLRPSMPWRIADSRRTPAALSEELKRRYGDRFQPWAECPPGWLAARLATTETVWVSEESVSMVYEALSAGCRVGILPVPGAKKRSRVLAGIRALVEQGVLRYLDSAQPAAPLLPAVPLNEARRVAHLILDQFHLTKDR